MDELGREFTEDMGEAVSETGLASATVELRKRRSTRIVQAVPLTVAGVDALGRQFSEHTSTLIINCHGCRYQSKHYVLKNMWVTLEVPHPEAGQPPRTVRGRVAWIQRPRTVRQLFQVALELELPGNAWGIAFPPDDWFAFPDAAQADVGAPGVADLQELSREVATALEKIRDESAGLYHLAQDAAAEALQRDLPRRLAPQLEELTRDLTAQLSREALAQGNAYAEQTGAALQTLGSACAQAEELLKRLREHAAAVEARIASFAASAEREAEETARAHESSASALAESLRAQANHVQGQASAPFSVAQQTWQNDLAGDMESALGRVQIAVDNAVAATQVQAAESLNDHANSVLQQFQQEAERLQAGFRESAALVASESNLRLAALK